MKNLTLPLVAFVFLAGLVSAQTDVPCQRVVNGKLYTVNWIQSQFIYLHGNVVHVSGDLLLVDIGNNSFHYILVKNYKAAKQPAATQYISFFAIQTGTQKFDYNDETYELWDCGTPPTATELAKFKAEDDARLMALKQQEKEKAQARLEAQKQQRQKNAQKIFELYTKQAAEGNGFAQMRLGEIYLHGEGVETNTVLARKWLSIAATNGFPKAADLLAEIPEN